MQIKRKVILHRVFISIESLKIGVLNLPVVVVIEYCNPTPMEKSLLMYQCFGK